MKIEPNKLYFSKISPCRFGDLENDTIIQILEDGRHSSPFIERWLEKHSNMIYVNGDKSYDFVKGENKADKIELKGFVKGKANLIPSKMIGAKRSYNKEEYIKYVNEKLGFIITIYYAQDNMLFYFFLDKDNK